MAQLVIDTNIVRNLGAGRQSANTFDALLTANVSVHLADGSATELIAALTSRRIPWDHWLIARDSLKTILSRREPILLGGQQGLQRAGFPVRHERTRRELDECAAEMKASWRILRNPSASSV